jgi:FRG domain
MKSIEKIQRLLQIGKHAFVVVRDEAVSARRICQTIAHGLDRSTVVAELRSDHISAEEGAFVHETLVHGNVLLLIASEGRELAAELLRAWEEFCNDPQHTYTNAGRFIGFAPPLSPSEHLGALGIVVPRSCRFEAEPFQRIWFEEEVQSVAPAASRMLGRPSVSLSMRALWFLHHRDEPEVRNHDSVPAIMEATDPITWADLQRLLQTQANHNMLRILEGFAAGGRLKPEQLDVAYEAVSFLRRENLETERIGAHGLAPSIYHLLWQWADLLEGEGCVFRGQRDSRWAQDPSLLRPAQDGSAPTVAAIVERVRRTQRFLHDLGRCEQQLVGHALNEAERLAVAQHYGMPTPLLDYTRSISVAAFFATGSGNASAVGADEIGIIYYISPHAAIAAPPVPDVSAGLDLARAAGLRIGNLTFIEPTLPDPENRISRQKALFVEGFESRDLQRLVSGALYFRQQEGEIFEDPKRGITRGQLLAPEARLARLAERIKPRPPRLSTPLGAAKVPGSDIFGALGLHLGANLHKAQNFLNELANRSELVEPGLWPQLKGIIEAHLNEARIASRTADFAAATTFIAEDSAGVRRMLDDVDLAFRELERVARVEPGFLANSFALQRPRNVLEASEHTSRAQDAAMSLSVASTRGQIVLAVGLFLVGLEYLRTVPGAVAEQYLQGAQMQIAKVGMRP